MKKIGYRLGSNTQPTEIVYINQDKKKPKKEPIEKKPTEHFIIDNNVHFELKGRAKSDSTYAIVSLNKWKYVSKYDWYLGKNGYPLCYSLGKMQLHRFVYYYVLGQKPPSELYIDHIDHNKLNNTDENLRLATPQENSFNKSSSSNLKGVRKISENNYSATITKDGKRHEIKNIPTAEQAAETYNLMAEELFGHFAAPNKLD